MPTPALSIVMPVYNVAPFLEECLDSVVEQSFRDFELITVNDGSTDDSLAILEKYAARDARVRVITKENGGYGIAMNTGLNVAQGEYVAVVESDDYIAENMFERLIQVAKEHDADMVKSRCSYFWDLSGERRFQGISDYPAELKDRALCPREEKAAFHLPLYICTGVYRRSWIEQHNIRFHETPRAAYQDTGFWFQTMSFANRAVWISDVLHFYRQTNPNSSINKTTNYETLIYEYDYIAKLMATKAPELWSELEDAYALDFARGMYFDYSRLEESVKPAFLRIVRPRVKEYQQRGLLHVPTQINDAKELFLKLMLTLPVPHGKCLVLAVNLMMKHYFPLRTKLKSR